MRFFDDHGKKGWGDRNKGRPAVGEELAILPLRNTVIYPGVVVPLTIGRPSSLQLIEDALKKDKIIGIVGQRDPDNDAPEGHDLFSVGTVAQISRVIRHNDSSNSMTAHVQGMQRMHITKYTQRLPYLKAQIQVLEENRWDESADFRSLFVGLKNSALQIVEYSSHIPQEVSQVIQQIESPGYLADLIAAYLNLSMPEKEDILECLDLRHRVQLVLQHVQKELQMLELNQRIQEQVKDELDKNQREYYLRKQLKAIKKELGEEEEEADELEEFREKIHEAHMPADVEKEALKELQRLSRIPPQSAEYTVARTYIEWMVELPWSVSTEDSLNIAEARRILNEDHYNLEKVKKRILEYLAVRKLKSDMKGPILCFVGPPGVGKTSLGRSIARAMGRRFVRIALGGVKDEAEIRGHRRTYVGALPGRIIQSLKKAKSNNPVFVLDEIDKLCSDMRGDPASALLEVLDPEQNDTFTDHYLDVAFDLSNVLFIATANLLDPIPHALRDRMEVIEIPGYTEEDKLQIARQYLIDKQHHEHGLTPGLVDFRENALRSLTRNYTREAGVRNLEREIASICRAIAMRVAEGDASPETIHEPELLTYLGPPKYFFDLQERVQEPGTATGLAWTAAGGELLFIEVTRMKGTGQLLLTGKLGDVMKESAQAGLSYIRTHAGRLGVPDNFMEGYDLHIHVPSGAVPKDGPSAGVALFSAIVSLLSGRKIRSDLAMTGEITLRGVVLPVGGIKEKVLAAHRANLQEVLIPDKNQKDLVDIPEEVRQSLSIRQISRLDEVIEAIFQPTPSPATHDDEEAPFAPLPVPVPVQPIFPSIPSDDPDIPEKRTRPPRSRGK